MGEGLGADSIYDVAKQLDNNIEIEKMIYIDKGGLFNDDKPDNVKEIVNIYATQQEGIELGQTVDGRNFNISENQARQDLISQEINQTFESKGFPINSFTSEPSNTVEKMELNSINVTEPVANNFSSTSKFTNPDFDSVATATSQSISKAEIGVSISHTESKMDMAATSSIDSSHSGSHSTSTTHSDAGAG